jgi:predicted translin family RNA/ssDNA-binding protein
MINILRKSIKEYQENQDLLYGIQKLSNEIRVNSKKVIALLRRENIRESKETIEEIENRFKLINEALKQHKDLLNQNFYKEAVEEYIEAITFYNFLTESQKKTSKFIKAEPEEIISGICDFTGELVRKAITVASSKNIQVITSYQKTVENIIQELTKVGFQGKPRQKYDEVERNLRKLEDIIYDLKLKE